MRRGRSKSTNDHYDHLETNAKFRQRFETKKQVARVQRRKKKDETQHAAHQKITKWTAPMRRELLPNTVIAPKKGAKKRPPSDADFPQDDSDADGDLADGGPEPQSEDNEYSDQALSCSAEGSLDDDHYAEGPNDYQQSQSEASPKRPAVVRKGAPFYKATVRHDGSLASQVETQDDVSEEQDDDVDQHNDLDQNNFTLDPQLVFRPPTMNNTHDSQTDESASMDDSQMNSSVNSSTSTGCKKRYEITSEDLHNFRFQPSSCIDVTAQQRHSKTPLIERWVYHLRSVPQTNNAVVVGYFELTKQASERYTKKLFPNMTVELKSVGKQKDAGKKIFISIVEDDRNRANAFQTSPSYKAGPFLYGDWNSVTKEPWRPLPVFTDITIGHHNERMFGQAQVEGQFDNVDGEEQSQMEQSVDYQVMHQPPNFQQWDDGSGRGRGRRKGSDKPEIDWLKAMDHIQTFNSYETFLNVGFRLDENTRRATVNRTNLVKDIFTYRPRPPDSRGLEDITGRLRLWQEKVIEILKGPWQKRPNIYWIWSKESETGKTTFKNYVCKLFHKQVLVVDVDDKRADVLHNFEDQKIIWFDLARADGRIKEEEMNRFYKNLEKFSDGGEMLSGKYTGSLKTIAAHIVVSANIAHKEDLIPRRVRSFRATTEVEDKAERLLLQRMMTPVVPQASTEPVEASEDDMSDFIVPNNQVDIIDEYVAANPEYFPNTAANKRPREDSQSNEEPLQRKRKRTDTVDGDVVQTEETHGDEEAFVLSQ